MSQVPIVVVGSVKYTLMLENLTVLDTVSAHLEPDTCLTIAPGGCWNRGESSHPGIVNPNPLSFSYLS